MNDARLSPDDVAAERFREREVFRTASRQRAASGRALGRPRGVLTVEEAAARQAQRQETGALTVCPASTAVAVPPPDAERSMRTVRLSLAAVLVLVLVFVWVRQRSGR